MAGSTKMILITSDEDIIRQFTLNNHKNTHIIDLDNNKHLTSIATENNNDMIDLNFLAHLSGLNSNNDHIYKRALDSSDHVRLKPAKAPKKSIDMICTICGDRAIGYNYNALSCGSCKAFFRRHVNHTLEGLPCLTNTGECSISYEERRKCQRCRLKRCLTMGMRKDFIQSEEEKERRKKRVEQTQTITSQLPPNVQSLSPVFTETNQLVMDVDRNNMNIVLHEYNHSNEIEHTSLENSLVEHSTITEKIRSAFLSVFPNDFGRFHPVNMTDRAAAITCWSEVANQSTLRFISFFRQIDEFEGLHADDRFILIKYNLFSLFHIHRCLYFNATNDHCWRDCNKEAERNYAFFKASDESNEFRKLFKTMIGSLIDIIEQDETLLSILLIILLFSQGLSMSEDEPSLKDPSAVARAQFYYTEILWNYMINKRGETKTCKQFAQLLTQIFRIQSGDKQIREFIRTQLTMENNLDLIGPLMQTVLRIA